MKILFPALPADHFPAVFPFLQTADGDPHCSCKGLLAQSQRFPIHPDAISLSITKKMIIIIQKICHWYTVIFRQLLCQFTGYVLCNTFFNRLVGTHSDPQFPGHIYLPQALTMSAPAKPVRNILNFPITMVLLIELSRFQNLSGGAQWKAMDIYGCIPHMRILRQAKNPHFIGKTIQNTPNGPFDALGCKVATLKVVGDRIAFSTHRAA